MMSKCKRMVGRKDVTRRVKEIDTQSVFTFLHEIPPTVTPSIMFILPNVTCICINLIPSHTFLSLTPLLSTQ